MPRGPVRRARPAAPPRVLGPIRPRPRWLELRLLALVAVALAVGSLSLEATVHGKLGLYDPEGLAIYVIALFAAHAAQVLAGRRTDQILLPTDRAARRDLAPAHAAPAPGPRDADILRDEVRAGRGPAHLAGAGSRPRHDPRHRRPLRQLAAPLQVHVGGRRCRPAAAHVRLRHRDQRPAPDPPARAVQRPADRAAQGHPGRLPGRLPVREPDAADGAGHAAGAAAHAAAAVSRADGRDVGDRARHRRRPARPGRGAAVLRRSSWRCSTSPPDGSAW